MNFFHYAFLASFELWSCFFAVYPYVCRFEMGTNLVSYLVGQTTRKNIFSFRYGGPAMHEHLSSKGEGNFLFSLYYAHSCYMLIHTYINVIVIHTYIHTCICACTYARECVVLCCLNKHAWCDFDDKWVYRFIILLLFNAPTSGNVYTLCRFVTI